MVIIRIMTKFILAKLTIPERNLESELLSFCYNFEDKKLENKNEIILTVPKNSHCLYCQIVLILLTNSLQIKNI
jgi:hypothetical protein